MYVAGFKEKQYFLTYKKSIEENFHLVGIAEYSNIRKYNNTLNQSIQSGFRSKVR